MRNLFLLFRKRKGCFILTLSWGVLVSSFSVKAQTAQIVPGSPEAASLSKMVNYPVSLNTGVPDISIPIYTIEVNGISVPIKLSYHAGGIKVNQQSTWVGLGWDLEVAPEVTRSVNGEDDFSPEGYLANTAVHQFNNHGPFSENKYYWDSMKDEEPDRFDYRLLTESGSFMYQKYADSPYEALAIPYRPIKIDRTNGLEITDEQGRNYKFGIADATDPDLSSNATSPYLTCWKCTKIISSSKQDTINFAYNEGRIIHNYAFTDRLEILDSVGGGNARASFYYYSSGGADPIGMKYPEGSGIWGGRGIYIKDVIEPMGIGFHYGYIKVAELPIDPQMTESEIHNYTLKEINFRGGKVKIYSVKNGESGSKLDSIKVFDEKNHLIKMARFYMSYFNPQRYPQLILQDDRLRLDSVVFSGSGYDKQKYSFDYHPSQDHPWTKESDAWGYYNNEGSPYYAGSSVPLMNGISVSDPFSPDVFLTHYIASIGYANIESSEEPMRHFMLKKIINPLGGKTEFEYAANRYMDNGELKLAGGLRIEKIKFFNSASDAVSSTEKIYKYGENEDGAGKLKIKQDFANYSYEQTLWNVDPITHNTTNYRKRTFVSRSMSDLFYANGCPVNYTTVTEYNKDGGLATGKTVYRYGEFDFGSGVSTIQNGSRYSNTNIANNRIEIKGGELLSTTKYVYNNGQYVWIQADTNKYTQYTRTDQIYIGKVYRKAVYGSAEAFDLWGSVSDFAYFTYPQPVGNMLLTSQESKSREPGNLTAITSKTVNYYYDNPSHQQVTRRETTESDGSIQTDLMTYPQDYGAGKLFIDNMKANNMAAYPIEQVAYLQKGTEKKILSGSITQYQDSGNGLIDKIYAIETTAPISLATFKFSDRAIGVLPPAGTATVFSMDARYKLKQSYDGYDMRGNILSMSKEKGDRRSYKWAYNKLYPVAEVMNSSGSEFYHQNFEEGSPDYNGETILDYDHFHTGKASIKISNSGSAEKLAHGTSWTAVSLTAKKKFIYSGWVYSDGPSVQLFLFMMRAGETGYFSYSDNIQTTVTGKWIYLRKEFEVPADVANVFLRLDNNSKGNVWFDDLQIYPSEGRMNTYTYEPLVGMTSAIDESGKTVYYEYDTFHRLMNIRNQNWDIIKSYDYHYKP